MSYTVLELKEQNILFVGFRHIYLARTVVQYEKALTYEKV